MTHWHYVYCVWIVQAIICVRFVHWVIDPKFPMISFLCRTGLAVNPDEHGTDYWRSEYMTHVLIQREEKSTKTTALHRHTEFIIYSNYQLAVCLSSIIAFQITKASLLIHFSLFAKRKEKKKELSSTIPWIALIVIWHALKTRLLVHLPDESALQAKRLMNAKGVRDRSLQSSSARTKSSILWTVPGSKM